MNEIQKYWMLCQRLRTMQTDAGRAMVLNIEIPAFLKEVTNPKIIERLETRYAE